jgi:hypothetical protein
MSIKKLKFTTVDDYNIGSPDLDDNQDFSDSDEEFVEVKLHLKKWILDRLDADVSAEPGKFRSRGDMLNFVLDQGFILEYLCCKYPVVEHIYCDYLDVFYGSVPVKTDENGDQIIENSDDLVPVTVNTPFWLFDTIKKIYDRQKYDFRDENDLIIQMLDDALTLSDLKSHYPEVEEAIKKNTKRILDECGSNG